MTFIHPAVGEEQKFGNEFPDMTLGLGFVMKIQSVGWWEILLEEGMLIDHDQGSDTVHLLEWFDHDYILFPFFFYWICLWGDGMMDMMCCGWMDGWMDSVILHFISLVPFVILHLLFQLLSFELQPNLQLLLLAISCRREGIRKKERNQWKNNIIPPFPFPLSEWWVPTDRNGRASHGSWAPAMVSLSHRSMHPCIHASEDSENHPSMD